MKALAWRLAPLFLAIAVVLAVNISFHGELVRDLDGRLLEGSFHHGHIWCMDHLADQVRGAVPLTIHSDAVGFPEGAAARCLMVLPAVAAAPFQAWLGAVGTYNLTVLLTPVAAAVAACLLARRATDMDERAAAAVAVLYATSPFLLGSLSGGQVCKAQTWTIPACLWALTGVIQGPRRAAWALAAGILGVATAYSEPTFALIVPLVAAPWALFALRRPWGWSLLGACVGLAVLAAGLYTARLYYDSHGGMGTELFEPAGRLNSSGIPKPTPMAQLSGIFQAADLDTQAGATNHVSYLNGPLLIAMLAGTFVAWRGRVLAWVALVVGVTFALGEYLVVNDAYVTTPTGAKYGLPAWWLAKAGYPLARSVMYYRAIAVAGLGVALGAIGACSRWKWGWMLAWGVAAVGVWDTHRELAPIWPLKSRPLRSELSAWMAADPTPGAILALPRQHNTRQGGAALFDAVLADRATTALVRFTSPEQPSLRHTQAWVAEALAAPDAASAEAALFAHGVRYVVWDTTAQDAEGTALTARLGPAARFGSRWAWRIGPD